MATQKQKIESWDSIRDELDLYKLWTFQYRKRNHRADIKIKHNDYTAEILCLNSRPIVGIYRNDRQENLDIYEAEKFIVDITKNKIMGNEFIDLGYKIKLAINKHYLGE